MHRSHGPSRSAVGPGPPQAAGSIDQGDPPDLPIVKDLGPPGFLQWNGTQGDRYRELAGELIRMNVDVFVTGNWESARAAKLATKAIPIVLLAVPDPPAAGLVGDQPDRKLTGIAYRPSELVSRSIEIIQ